MGVLWRVGFGRVVTAAGVVVVLLAVCGPRGVTGVSAEENASKPEYFTAVVQPIFEANCYRCHGGMNHRGGLSLQTRGGC